MIRRGVLYIFLFLATVLTVGCHQDFKESYSSLREELEIARERGGQWCASKEFASAESFLFLAKVESQNRNFKLALAYLDTVRKDLDITQRKCIDCKTDLDFDGISDIEDSDPYRAEDYDGWQDQDGIPDPDNDGDGFLDEEDSCPNSPEDFDSWEDKDGCPEIDNDMDGVPDGRDKCPMEVEDVDGWEDADGCPDPDNDSDGIPDQEDACPIAPETFNNFLDDDGCPDIEPKKRKIIRIPKVTFIGKSLKLSKRVIEDLEKFAETLIENPELYVRIEGYTSRSGTPDIQKVRTKERAEKIKQILVDFGLNEGRITTFGFGQPPERSKRSGYWVLFVIYQR